MNENDQKKLNMKLGKYGYGIQEHINEQKTVMYDLLFLKVVDKKISAHDKKTKKSVKAMA